jgi:putative hydrolase of the HAD superfamily
MNQLPSRIIPQVVVFDLGKVLVDFDYSIAARRISQRARLTAEAVNDFISHSPLLFRFETGLLTHDQFFQEICAVTGFCGLLDEFCEFFSDIFVPIEPMVTLQAELRRAGIPTYVFSNTNELAAGHIRRRFPFFGNFDGYILSYEHGAMKPDAKLYEVVEATSGRRASEILYLDDRDENIVAGAARGWQVILQETPEKSRREIEGLGLLAKSERTK